MTSFASMGAVRQHFCDVPTHRPMDRVGADAAPLRRKVEQMVQMALARMMGNAYAPANVPNYQPTANPYFPGQQVAFQPAQGLGYPTASPYFPQQPLAYDPMQALGYPQAVPYFPTQPASYPMQGFGFGFDQQPAAWPKAAQGLGRTGDGGAGLDTKSEAFTVLASHFDEISVDGLVTLDNLKAIAEGRLTGNAKNTNYPPELRAAAKFLVDNPDAFNQADTGDGRAFNHGGKHADNKISKADMSVAMNESKMTRNEIRAFNNLMKHIDKLPTLFGASDLEAMARNESLPLEARDAAAYVLSSKGLLQRLDVGRFGGAGDGLIHRVDMEAISKRAEVVGWQERATFRAQASFQDRYQVAI